jgi:hypothetical protein
MPENPKENFMKRSSGIVAISVMVLLGFASAAQAQMGMDLFNRPAIAKLFNPVVGKGAQYEVTRKTSKEPGSRQMEMGVVGKEMVEGKEGYWMQFVTSDAKGQTILGKSLLTKDDFQFRRMIMQMPGQQPIEMPVNPKRGREDAFHERMNEWVSAGTETITVPAGTYSCERWHNAKTNGDLWTSEKVTPFGMVKEVDGNGSMVLTKLLTDVPDRITGSVQKFDPQQMMQRMQPPPEHEKP